MELTKIEALLIKYEDGATNLEEELILKEYFAKGDVPEQWSAYGVMFAHMKKAKDLRLENSSKISSKIKNNRSKYALVGIAASLALALGVFFYEDNNHENLVSNTDYGTIEDPEEAYLKTKQTLQMISEVFNNGKEDLGYIKEFNNTKDKFINE